MEVELSLWAERRKKLGWNALWHMAIVVRCMEAQHSAEESEEVHHHRFHTYVGNDNSSGHTVEAGQRLVQEKSERIHCLVVQAE